MTHPELHARITTLLTSMESGLYERSEAVRVAFLAAVAGESVFFLGPPGVAKSLIARRVKHAFRNASSFEYLMGRFSTPEEIFGPISLKKLKESDSYERLTTSYLPEAEVVFLDEIWKASPPIQNALLTALNERLYRNGAVEVQLPLKLVIAASNEVPDTRTEQAAFWDRFLVRVVLKPIAEQESFRRLIAEDDDPYADPVPEEVKIDPQEYDTWRAEISRVEVPDAVLDLLWAVATSLPETVAGSAVSDRRWKKIARLLRAAAFLHGRDRVSILDCGILPYALWSDPEHRGAVEEAVHGVIRRYDHGWQEAIEGLRRQVDAAERALVDDATEERIATVDVPRIYRGEYYRLADHPFEGSVLLWRGDFDRIDGGEARRCELFFYTAEDQYSHTEPAALTRVGNRIETSAESYTVETERRTERIVESRGPSETTRREHRAAGERMLADIAAMLGDMEAYRARLVADAGGHLFLDAPASEAILEGLDRAIDAAGALDLDVRRHVESLSA